MYRSSLALQESSYPKAITIFRLTVVPLSYRCLRCFEVTAHRSVVKGVQELRTLGAEISSTVWNTGTRWQHAHGTCSVEPLESLEPLLPAGFSVEEMPTRRGCLGVVLTLHFTGGKPFVPLLQPHDRAVH
jgi:hypothetical protein